MQPGLFPIGHCVELLARDLAPDRTEFWLQAGRLISAMVVGDAIIHGDLKPLDTDGRLIDVSVGYPVQIPGWGGRFKTPWCAENNDWETAGRLLWVFALRPTPETMIDFPADEALAFCLKDVLEPGSEKPESSVFVEANEFRDWLSSFRYSPLFLAAQDRAAIEERGLRQFGDARYEGLDEGGWYPDEPLCEFVGLAYVAPPEQQPVRLLRDRAEQLGPDFSCVRGPERKSHARHGFETSAPWANAVWSEIESALKSAGMATDKTACSKAAAELYTRCTGVAVQADSLLRQVNRLREP